MQAEVCKVLANAKRIEIIYILKNGEKNVNQLAEQVEASKASISQHLSLLKESGVVTSRKDGLHVYYRISNKKFIEACELMKEIMLDQLNELISSSQELLSTEG
ncbi:MAG: ArsR/SmtB family transcription factor [Bacillota bacterium]